MTVALVRCSSCDGSGSSGDGIYSGPDATPDSACPDCEGLGEIDPTPLLAFFRNLRALFLAGLAERGRLSL